MSLDTKLAIAALVVTIIGVIIAWLQLRKKDPPITSLKQSPVESSAIISGSHNQVVIHPALVPSHPPAPVAPKIERPKPNIRYLDASATFLGSPLDKKGPPNAVVIRFANDARPGTRNVEASVKATLIYLDVGREICAVTGNWLNENRDYAQFEVDGRYTLVAGQVVRGELQAPTKRRTVAHLREYFLPEFEPLENVQIGTLLVRLTDASTGDWLFEKRFTITLNPLSIEPIEERKLTVSISEEALAYEILSIAREGKKQHPNRAFVESMLCIELGETPDRIAKAMDLLFIKGRAKHTGFPGTWTIDP